MSKTNQIAAFLAVAAMLLALGAVSFKYFKHGEFDFTLMIAGVVIPAVIIPVVLAKNSNKQ